VTNLASAGAVGAAAASKVATKGNLAHGALMILAWGCLSPVGTVFMKYGKHLPPSIWFKTHKFIQPLAILVTIIAFIIILASGVVANELNGAPKSKQHANMGFAVLILCIVQGLLGYFREKISGHTDADKGTDYPHGPNRNRFNAVHRTVGWVLFGLALATIYKGVVVFEDQMDSNPKAWLQEPAKTLFKAYCFVSLALIVVLEVLHATKYDWGNFGPFSCTGNHKIYDTFTASGDFEMKVRSIALAIFTAFSIACTVAMWVIIADTDSQCFAKDVSCT